MKVRIKSLTSKRSQIHSENIKDIIKNTPGIVRSKIPEIFFPQLAFLTNQVPKGNNWIHEIKYDGYRIITIIRNGKAKFLTRRGKDWTHYFSALSQEFRNFPVDNAILDGELVTFGREGISNFQILQNTLRAESGQLSRVDFRYYVFDLPYCQGYNLVHVKLLDRKAILKQLLQNLHNINKTRLKKSYKKNIGGSAMILYSDHIQDHGAQVYRKACQHHLEGTISKQTESFYEQRRTHAWLKNKCGRRQEFVIGGYTSPRGGRKHFGALLLGYYDNQGKLIYAGRVGTGFTDKSLAEIYQGMTKYRQLQSPFFGFPLRPLKQVFWLKPKLVAEVKFLEWTHEGILRHPSFAGLRMDKKPREVIREEG